MDFESTKLLFQFENYIAGQAPLPYFDIDNVEEIVHLYLETELYDYAERLLEVAQEQHPGDEELECLNVELLLAQGKPEEALRYMDSHFSDDDKVFLSYRVSALAQTNQLDKAAEFAKELLSQPDSDRDGDNYNLGIAYLEANQPADALTYFLASEQANDENIDTKLSVLTCYQELGDAEKALEYVDKALALDAYCMTAWYKKAEILIEHEKYAEAAEAAEYCYAISPQNIDVLYLMITVTVALKRFAEAENYIKELKEVSADSEDEMIGQIYFMFSDPNKAIPYFEKAIVDNPANEVVKLMLANCYELNEEADKAIVILTELQQQNPTNPAIVAMLSSAYADSKQADTAIDICLNFLKEDKTSDIIYFLAITMMVENSRSEEAYELALEALQLRQNATTLFLTSLAAWNTDKKLLSAELLARGMELNEEIVEQMRIVEPDCATYFEQWSQP